MNIFKRIFSSDKKRIRSLKNILGFTPNNFDLYELAFRHKSVAEEIKNGIKNSNERLEYLGDAILGAVVAEFVFKRFPYKGEGFLTEMRSRIVNRDHLNKLARKIGMKDFIQNNSDTSLNRSMYGDAFEALVGAIYLDKGHKVAQHFILNRIIKHHVDIDELEHTENNFKSKLIEWAQREKKIVNFDLIEKTEQEDYKQLKVQVIIDGKEFGIGIDFSKKKAEQIAAEVTCKLLNI